jgi:Zn-dependent protease with chaperone function/RNA polymerase subunit RPABC4/transcription elongation factor Spt4
MESSALREFPGLSPAAFQHPWDVEATANLDHVPLLGTVLKKVSGHTLERWMRMWSISNSVRLGPNQGGSVYQKFVKAARILDLPELPEIYVSSNYVINAFAFGLEKYQITLFAGLIDFLTEAELLAVIGHELGHIKCQHMLYKSLAYILRYVGVEVMRNLLPAGTGLLALLSLQLAILEWERKAELSCDRSALLVVQNRQVVASALSKLAGGSKTIMPEIHLDSILDQAQEYEDTGDGFMEQIFKVNMLMQQTHPFPIVRAKEIMTWAESEQYQAILRGDYLHQASSTALTVTEPVGKVCPGCQRVVNASESRCRACGSNLKGGRLVCTKCGIKVFSTWQTCPRCGSQLQQPVELVAAE